MAFRVFVHLFEARPGTPQYGIAIQLLKQYPRQVVESRVESVQWKEDGSLAPRLLFTEKCGLETRLGGWQSRTGGEGILFSLKRGSLLSIPEERQANIRSRNCAASIDCHCHKPSAIVTWRLSLKFWSERSRSVVNCVQCSSHL